MVEKTGNSKYVKRKTLNLEYDIARKLEKMAVNMEMTQTELINLLLKQGLKKLENQTTLEI